MKLNLKGLTLTCALLWAGTILIVGLANMAWPNYGKPFLELCSSIYPGYHVTGSIGSVLVGTLYGMVDGAIGGAIFAALYNKLSPSS